MFSLDRFYNILHNNLIAQFTNGRSVHFYPFGTYQHTNILDNEVDTPLKPKQPIEFIIPPLFHAYFFDQEPLYDSVIPIINSTQLVPDHIRGARRIDIFANSEKSEFKRKIVKDLQFYDWYYFFHGFAALDWYRDFQYVNPSSFNRFNKVFICYNHLISKYRSYRLHLVSNLIEQDLLKYGHVSLALADSEGTWRKTIENPETPLDNRARVKIYHALKNINAPLTIDTDKPHGAMSANVSLDWLTDALFHVVTETVYFQPKLHLTEKVFKPIVARRPFFLVSTPGSLAYLKSYGFKTFDRWIDESYDQEPDHYVRIEKITFELAKLCAMSPALLKQMHTEMNEVLEYNFNHFYTTFKDMIVDELVDNFDHILCQINNGRQPNNHSRYHQRFELAPGYLQEVKKRLKQ
jgi:hypothetical protein